MTQAKPGDTLHVHYTGKLDDGTVFDSSEGRDPLAFELGAGQIIPGLDAGVAGMEVGEKRSVRVEPAEAYGEHEPERVQAVDRARRPRQHPHRPGHPAPGANPGRARPSTSPSSKPMTSRWCSTPTTRSPARRSTSTSSSSRSPEPQAPGRRVPVLSGRRAAAPLPSPPA